MGFMNSIVYAISRCCFIHILHILSESLLQRQTCLKTCRTGFKPSTNYFLSICHGGDPVQKVTYTRLLTGLASCIQMYRGIKHVDVGFSVRYS
jgi:hypothetical protein